MAEFGAKYPCFCKKDANAGVVLGKLVVANLTVTLASGELYADDGLDEQASEFASGSIAMETNDLTDDNASEIYGCTVSEGLVTYNIGNDNSQTKGSSITFATSQTTFTVMPDDNGDWRKTKTFSSETEAKSWLNGLCKIAAVGGGTGGGGT